MTLDEQFKWWERQNFKADCPCHGEIHDFVRTVRDEIEQLTKMLETAREAIAQAPEDAFGSAGPAHDHHGYWIRDELVYRITKVLSGTTKDSNSCPVDRHGTHNVVKNGDGTTQCVLCKTVLTENGDG